GTCGISTSAPSQLQRAMIAAATATNKEAAIRILANPRGTLPPEVSLSLRPGRCQARGYDLAAGPPNFGPVRQLFAGAYWRPACRVLLFKNHGALDKVPGYGALGVVGGCRVAGRKRPGRRGIAAETAQHLERLWSLPVC